MCSSDLSSSDIKIRALGVLIITTGVSLIAGPLSRQIGKTCMYVNPLTQTFTPHVTEFFSGDENF